MTRPSSFAITGDRAGKATWLGLLAVSLSLSALDCTRRDPTYHEDVYPILQARCAQCHAPDGVAPTPFMQTYADVKRSAKLIKQAVQTRAMPPWGADNTGLCGTWQDALWLDEKEIRTIVQWADSGKKEGNRPHAAAPVAAAAAPRLATKTSLDAETYAPGVGDTAYRCFLADPKLATDQFLTGYAVESSERRIVQQVTLFALDSPAAEADAARLDEQDAGPGWSCYGNTRTAARFVSSWSWNTSVLRMPTGTGLRLQAGRKMVVQVHYNITAAGMSAATSIHVPLELAARVPREATILTVEPRDFVLAPERPFVETTGQVKVDRAVDVLALSPRMHVLGRTLEINRERGGARSCLANFDHWKFYEQRQFNSAVPVLVEAGDVLNVTCSYTTQGSQGPVKMGETIHDEECLAWLYVVPR